MISYKINMHVYCLSETCIIYRTKQQRKFVMDIKNEH